MPSSFWKCPRFPLLKVDAYEFVARRRLALTGSTFVGILKQVSDLMASGNSHEAINSLLSVQDLIRSEPLACNTLAYLLLHSDKPQEAIPWFEAVLAVNPGNAQGISGLGLSCQATGDLVRALQCYEAALVFRWNHATAWYHHGALLAQLGRLREALSEPRQGDRTAGRLCRSVHQTLPGSVGAWRRFGGGLVCHALLSVSAERCVVLATFRRSLHEARRPRARDISLRQRGWKSRPPTFNVSTTRDML